MVVELIEAGDQPVSLTISRRIRVVLDWAPPQVPAIVLAAMAIQAGACLAAPTLQLDAVEDRAVLDALLADSNLPALASILAEFSSEDRSALIETERTRLLTLMKAFGYLRARVEVADQATTTTSGSNSAWPEPTQTRLKPVPGPLYRIGSIELDGVGDGVDPAIGDDLEALLTEFVGGVARADALSRLEDEIIFRVASASRPFSKVVVRELVPDPELATAAVRIKVDMGRSVRLGSVTFEGLSRLDARSLEAYVPFSPGAPYRPSEIESLRNTLNGLHLFRKIDISVAEAPDSQGRFPVQVKLTEQPPAPELLAREKYTGMFTMAAALVALALRQMALAVGVETRSRYFRLSSVLVYALLVISVLLVVRRALTFVSIA
jgi:outer membrane translocation and assembly module TamA